VTKACFVLRATRRNRDLVRAHQNFFGARFPGSAQAWLDSLTNPDAPLPEQPALIWITVNGAVLPPWRA
jgi:hypothetical protein